MATYTPSLVLSQVFGRHVADVHHLMTECDAYDIALYDIVEHMEAEEKTNFNAVMFGVLDAVAQKADQ